jgi:hypothetical protein
VVGADAAIFPRSPRSGLALRPDLRERRRCLAGSAADLASAPDRLSSPPQIVGIDPVSPRQ